MIYDIFRQKLSLTKKHCLTHILTFNNNCTLYYFSHRSPLLIAHFYSWARLMRRDFFCSNFFGPIIIRLTLRNLSSTLSLLACSRLSTRRVAVEEFTAYWLGAVAASFDHDSYGQPVFFLFVISTAIALTASSYNIVYIQHESQ